MRKVWVYRVWSGSRGLLDSGRRSGFHDTKDHQLFPVIVASSLNLLSQSRYVRNHSIAIIDEKYEVLAVRVVLVHLDVVMEFLTYLAAMLLVPYVLSLDDRLELFRNEILN